MTQASYMEVLNHLFKEEFQKKLEEGIEIGREEGREEMQKELYERLKRGGYSEEKAYALVYG